MRTRGGNIANTKSDDDFLVAATPNRDDKEGERAVMVYQRFYLRPVMMIA